MLTLDYESKSKRDKLKQRISADRWRIMGTVASWLVWIFIVAMTLVLFIVILQVIFLRHQLG